MSGWIKINRDLNKHWLWKDPQRLYWWIDLLFLANWEDRKELVGNTLVDVKRGQALASIGFLSKRWRVSIDTVRKYLRLLQSDNMIEQEAHSKYNVLTICNYEKYQDVYNPNADLNSNPNNNPNDNPKEEDKEVEEEKDNNIPPYNPPTEEKPKRTRKQFVIPTVEEVAAYCAERKNNIDAQYFVDFYTSKGWMVGSNHMKDWKSAVRTWEAKRKQQSTPTPANNPAGILLGPGEFIRQDGSRTYGTDIVTVPQSAPPRPNERCTWSSQYNNWIM